MKVVTFNRAQGRHHYLLTHDVGRCGIETLVEKRLAIPVAAVLLNHVKFRAAITSERAPIITIQQ